MLVGQKEERALPSVSSPIASVIVPAYNQQEHLDACLRAVLADRPGDVQILVVDDGSSDRTVEVAEARGVEVIRSATNRGPAAARNLGARHATGEVLVFVDADVVLAPGALRRMIDALAHDPTLASVFGSYDASPHARTLVSEYRNLLHHFTHQWARCEATTFWSGCGAIRASAFRAVGGFDERPELNYIEDVELGRRLARQGYRIRLDKGLQSTHRKRWTMLDMVRTDILFRARPWSSLILSDRGLTNDLNLRWSQRVAVPLAVIGTALVASGIFWPSALLGGAVTILAALGLSAPFFRFLVSARGASLALACAPLHLLHHLCSAAGLVIALYERGRSARPFPAIETPDQARP